MEELVSIHQKKFHNVLHHPSEVQDNKNQEQTIVGDFSTKNAVELLIQLWGDLRGYSTEHQYSEDILY